MRCACCAAALLFVSSSAAAGEPPAVAPPTPAPPTVTLAIKDNALIATDPKTGGVPWLIQHGSVKAIVGHMGSPVRVRDRVYYAYSVYLMEVDPDPVAGRVTRRVPFPGRITGLAGQGEAVRVYVKSPGGEGARAEPYTYTPGESPTLLLPADRAAIEAAQKDADRLLQDFNLRGFTGQYQRGAAETAILSRTYDEAAARNPTNPWFYFDKGVVLDHLGRSEEARRAFRAAAAVEGAPFYEHLRIASLLAETGAETGAERGEGAESDLSFERGYAEFVRAGLEPEQVMSTEALRLYYAAAHTAREPGRPDSHAQAVTDSVGHLDADRVIELMERVWRLAPRCEGAAYAFAGAAEFLEEHGRSGEAAIWAARARAAAGYTESVWGRQAAAASVACLAALAVMLGVLIIKPFSAQRQDLARLGGWLASWRRPGERFTHLAFAYARRLELLGLLLLAAGGFVSAYLAVQSERVVARALNIPPEAQAGSWGHPQSVATFEKFDKRNPAGRLLYGIARHQAGEVRRAEEVYKDLSKDLSASKPGIAAIAENNRGVILFHSPRRDLAADSFKRALRLDPDLVEAKYNLGEPVDSPRTSRARKYRRGKKLLALPDADMLAAAFADAPAPERKPGARELRGKGTFVRLAWVTRILSALAGLLVLPFLVIRKSPPSVPVGGTLAGLAYVVPGTSARLAPVGGLVLAAWVYCLITTVLLFQGGDAAGGARQQKAAQTFGLAKQVVFPFERAIGLAAPLVFIGLWIVNGSALKSRRRRAAEEGMGEPGAFESRRETVRVIPSRPVRKEAEPPAPRVGEVGVGPKPSGIAGPTAEREEKPPEMRPRDVEREKPPEPARPPTPEPPSPEKGHEETRPRPGGREAGESHEPEEPGPPAGP